MNSRALALTVAFVCIGGVLAQDIVPSWAGFHTWQYAAALLLGICAMFAYMGAARKGEDGATGARLTIAMIGAIVVSAAGIASGLLGPDTETVVRAPGVVAPLPDVGAAAFFPNADAGTIGRGDAQIVLRQRNGESFELTPNGRHFSGSTAIEQQPQTAVYVEVTDLKGNHLTITQPTNSSFLSPVLFFPQTVPIAGRNLPADTFATPAVHRQIKAFFFSKTATAAGQMHGLQAGQEAVLFAVDDDGGTLVPGGIGFAQGDKPVVLGDVRIRATIGTYPALVISAVPYPLGLWLGGACFLGGLLYAFVPRAGGDSKVTMPGQNVTVETV